MNDPGSERPAELEDAEASPNEVRARRLKEASTRVLKELSQTVVSGAYEAVVETDDWFLATIEGLDNGVRHTKDAVERFGRYVLRESGKLRPDRAEKQSPRDRIRELLQREAKRSNLTDEEFDAFSDQIAGIIELVLVGKVSVADIAFEEDEHTSLLDPDSSPTSPRG